MEEVEENPTYLGVSRGLWYMLGSALFFSLMSLMVKAAGQRLPSSEIVLARAGVALVLSYVLLRRRGIPVLGGDAKHLLLLRGLLGFGGLTCFFYALTRLPLADASVIIYMNPLFVAVFAAAFLKERIGWAEFGALLVSLCGVVLIAQPSVLFGGDARLDMVAVAVAVVGAVFAGAAYTTVRALRGREDPLVVIFYFPLIATPLALPVAWPELLMPTPWEWLLLLGVGATTQIAQVFLTRGLYLEPAGRAMSVSYVQIVFAFLWGALLFEELPTTLSVVGVCLILGSSFAVSRIRAGAQAKPESP